MSTEKSLINLCIDFINSPDGEEMQLLEAKLNSIGHKADNYIALDRFADSQIDMIRREVEFLQKRIKSYENLQKGLRFRAQNALNILGLDELEGENGHKISIRETSSIEVVNLTEIPEKFVKKKLEYSADKAMIREALNSGETVSGVKLLKSKTVVFK